jgi:glycosyltransferase involved in cell wall biosynthesis
MIARHTVLPEITFWLPKPMIVYSPILRHLAKEAKVSLRVVYFGRDREDLFDDKETGAKAVWNKSLLEGHTSSWCGDSFGRGWREGMAAFQDRERGIGILAGTEHSFSRGVLAASWLSGGRLLVRYDARLDAIFGTPAREALRRLALRCLFKRTFRLGFTGTDTQAYLLSYGAKREQLWHFPYIVDHDLIEREVAVVRHSRAEKRIAVGLKPDTIVVVAALKFNDRESPLDVVEALARTHSRRLHLVLVGDGPLRPEVEALIALKCPGRVSLPGFLPYTELLQYYGLADIFVHPAHTEVWGVSVNEAMASGLVVVASNGVGAARELIQKEQNGLLYSAGDTAKLAKILDQLADDEDLRRRLTAGGTKTIQSYSPKAIASRITLLATGEESSEV